MTAEKRPEMMNEIDAEVEALMDRDLLASDGSTIKLRDRQLTELTAEELALHRLPARQGRDRF